MKTKYTRIIVDGLDAGGKSTLVKAIAEAHNMDARRETKETPNTYEWYSEQYKKDNWVSDRSFLSEIIFAPVFKRDINITGEEANKLYDQLREGNTLIIYCIPSLDFYKKTLEKRGEKNVYNPRDVIQAWNTLLFSEGEKGTLYNDIVDTIVYKVDDYEDLDKFQEFVEGVINV